MDGVAAAALRSVLHRVQESAERCGRKADRIRVVAVSKTKPVPVLRQIYDAGHRCFGENYVQEIVEKAPQLPDDIQWHYIGNLQSNKVKPLLTGVPNLAMVETVDDEKLPELSAFVMVFGLVMFGSMLTTVVKAVANTKLVDKDCSTSTFDANDPYMKSVEYVVNMLATTTASNPGHDVRVQSPYPEYIKTAYGHSYCRHGVDDDNVCAECIQVAYGIVYGECNGHTGAHAYLIDCSMRVENYEIINT